jgi:molybdopterin molybdotransferase
MALTSVEDALAQLLRGVPVTGNETLPLADALHRVLAEDLTADRAQPPFPASAMDGYAVRAADATVGQTLKVIGQSRAGARFDGTVSTGEAVRIFTGAPVPDGADAILIQENAEASGAGIRVLSAVAPGRFVRPEGLDFKAGETLIDAGTELTAPQLALAASMNRPAVTVRRKPRVAVIATGDELVPPGAEPGIDQIISSNGIGVSLLVCQFGGEPDDRGIAADRIEAIDEKLPGPDEADILVLIGGASVGDHDLVQDALLGRGMELDFWRIAMRPGKPLMVGRLNEMRVLGLPGNPVSAMVCSHIFLKPLIRTMLGLPAARSESTARLATAMAANDERQDYVRATLSSTKDGIVATPFNRQDSSMLATLARSDALIIRPPHAPAAKEGEMVPIMILGSAA